MSNENTNRCDRTKHLYTNHFTCSLNNNIPFYEYDVVVVEEIDRRFSNWRKCEHYPKCVSIIQSIVGNNQLEQDVFLWYDSHQYLYSTSHLPTPRLIHSTCGRYRLTIKWSSNQWSTTDINNYIDGKTEVFPYDAMRIIDALLKSSLAHRIKIVKNKFYFLDGESSGYNDDFEQKTGLKRRYGFFQELNLFSGRLTLNIQTVATLFFTNISLLEFIHKQIGFRMPTDNDYKKLSRILKNCLITADEAKYQFEKFDYRRPYEIQIESGELLIDYYLATKNIRLEHINYPCIQVHLKYDHTKTMFLPLEVCNIEGWRICDKSLFDEYDDEKSSIPTPNERYNQIVDTLHNCDFNENSLCQVVGFHVDDEEMLHFDARISNLPTIRTGLKNFADIDEGQICVGGQTYTAKSISKLAITYFGTKFNQKRDGFKLFTDTLIEAMEDQNTYRQHDVYTVTPSLERIAEHFYSLNKQNYQFIICIMDSEYEDDLTQLRINIKKCGTIIYGIMTQCVRYSEISSDGVNLRDYCGNLIRKINFKNGGINVKVDLNAKLENKRSPDDFYMYFGAVLINSTDLIHQNSSIAAVVGSGNSSCSTTAVRVSKQYPKEGTSSTGTIAGITEICQQLFDYYREKNKCFPNRIVFYREGNDDEHFAKILKFEVPAIRQAFQNIYGDETKHPLLTLIAVKKRHNTRFFTYNPEVGQSRNELKDLPQETGNIPIGCIVDTTIVHPHQHNFYLNSHNTDHGVNCPPFYCPLLNENGLTTDELQLLTYRLCFTDPRSSFSEAVPSVVHQANVAASNARNIFYSDKDSLAMEVVEQNSMSDNAYYQILKVHEKLKNKPALL